MWSIGLSRNQQPWKYHLNVFKMQNIVCLIRGDFILSFKWNQSDG